MCYHTRVLQSAHKNAWIAFFVSSSNMRKKVDDALRAAGCVPLELYGLLLSLEESPDQRARMSELANLVFLTKSGVTRLVDRAERLGLVTRQACPSDRRGLWAVLTAQGRVERSRAWTAYASAIEREFASSMTTEEAKTLYELLSRLTGDGRQIGLELD